MRLYHPSEAECFHIHYFIWSHANPKREAWWDIVFKIRKYGPREEVKGFSTERQYKLVPGLKLRPFVS